LLNAYFINKLHLQIWGAAGAGGKQIQEDIQMRRKRLDFYFFSCIDSVN